MQQQTAIVVSGGKFGEGFNGFVKVCQGFGVIIKPGVGEPPVIEDGRFGIDGDAAGF